MTISSLGTSLSSFGQTRRCSIRAPSFRWTWWKWMLLDSVAEKTLTGTLTSPKTIVPFQIERGDMAVWLPRSIQEERDLLDGRAIRDALLLARVTEVQQADRPLIGGHGERRAAGLGLHDRHGAPVAGEPARVCGEQHDVGGHGGGEHVLVVLRSIAGLLDGRGDQRRRAIELGAAARLGVLGHLLECLARDGAQHAEAPRVGEVVIGRPAGELEQLEQDVVGDGVRAERLVRAAGADQVVGRAHPGDATSRRTASSAFGSPWSWTSWPAPLTIIS